MALMVGHFGSCGPTTLPSSIGLYLQYPGWWIMARIEYFCWFFAKHNLELPLVLVLQAVVWSVVWYLILDTRKRMTRKVAPLSEIEKESQPPSPDDVANRAAPEK